MKSVEILLFYFIYLQLNKANANSTKLLQITGLKTENIIHYGGTDSIYYKFKDNEILQLTCSRKSVEGRRMRLSWYKSGIKLDTTLDEELKQRFILKEADAELYLECRLDEENESDGYNKYQELKVIILKNEKYLSSHDLLAMEQPRPDATELVIDKRKLIFYSIGLLVILIAIAILITIFRTYKIKQKDPILDIKEDLQVKFEQVDPASKMNKDYSHPKDNQLYSKVEFLYDLPTSQCSESNGYSHLVNNNYYVNELEYQNVLKTKDYVNVDNQGNSPLELYSTVHS